MSLRRKLLRDFWDFVGTSRRQLRRLAVSPGLVAEYAGFRGDIRRRDWQSLHAKLRPLADAALRAKDFRILMELGGAAARLDEPQLGAELVQAGRRLKGIGEASDWRGEDISDATLVVRLAEAGEQKVATGMPLVGHIRAASLRARRTIVLADARMAPLYRRSLPDLIVLPLDADWRRNLEGRVVTAGLADLQFHIGYDEATIVRLRVPLVADAAETRELRERYRGTADIPLVGISWQAPQYGKDSPPLEPWIRLVQAVPARFVSLQRDPDPAEVEALQAGQPGRLIVDSSVDQMANIDRFASQIAALDHVATVSNTGAHLAGSLGKPMILVRDDLFRLNWPYLSRRVPWYPDACIIGKDGRSWRGTFDEIIVELKAMLAASTPG
jgi:hypothetical protein